MLKAFLTLALHTYHEVLSRAWQEIYPKIIIQVEQVFVCWNKIRLSVLSLNIIYMFLTIVNACNHVDITVVIDWIWAIS